MASRIGEFLVRTGKMTPEQVEQVLLAQKQGDARSFGEIARSLNIVGDDSIVRFAEYLEKSRTDPT
jgi:hypothetical protein